MKCILRALLACAIPFAAATSQAADGVAFITNLKGDITVDSARRPLLLSELGKGQVIAVSKDSQLAIMYIQSGKEYILKGPGEYTVGEREINAGSGMPPPARETAWRTNSEVLVKVGQSSAASIRMRSLARAKARAKPKLDFPTEGAVATLQPTLRWTALDIKPPFEVALAVVGKDAAPLGNARVSGTSHRFPTKLQPDTEYWWTVSADDREIGSARFTTLPKGVIQEVEQRRPPEKAEFSDRLMHALLLQQMGATQEAQEAWGRLAQERTDLPELTNLAK